jgi:hypothetical protein
MKGWVSVHGVQYPGTVKMELRFGADDLHDGHACKQLVPPPAAYCPLLALTPALSAVPGWWPLPHETVE